MDRKPLDNIADGGPIVVALRKESVDRKIYVSLELPFVRWSLSARRAWIENPIVPAELTTLVNSRSPQGERG